MTEPSKPLLESDLLIPAKDILSIVLTLPSTDKEEIQGMVQLQVEAISPYPIEKTAFSWELLSQKEGSSRVCIVLCALQRLEKLRETFRAEHQVEPRRIDVDLLVTWEQIKPQYESNTTGIFLLLYKGEYLYLLGIDGQAPCMIRSLPSPHQLTFETIQEELQLANVSLASTFPNVSMEQVHIWAGDEIPEGSEALLQHWDGKRHALNTLPPITETLERRRLQKDVVDLTPTSWRAEEEKKLSRRKNMTFIRLLLGIWVVFMVILLGFTQLSKVRLQRQQDAALLKRDRVEQVAALAAKVRSLSQRTDQEESALNTLLLLAESLPGNQKIQIDSFRYQRDEQAFCTGSIDGSINSFHLFLEALSSLEDLEVNQYELKETSRGLNFQLDFRWQEWPDTSGGTP